MLKYLSIVPEDVALHIYASARLPGWISVRLTKTDNSNICVDEHVVLSVHEAIFLEQDRVVVVDKDVPCYVYF
ncbi:hypothetical protein ES703_62065 [subsurface metagenome]